MKKNYQQLLIPISTILIFIAVFVAYPYYFPGKTFFIKNDQVEVYSAARGLDYYVDWKDIINTYYFDSSQPLITVSSNFVEKDHQKIYFGPQSTDSIRFPRDFELPNGYLLKKNTVYYIQVKNNEIIISDSKDTIANQNQFLFGRTDLWSSLRNYYSIDNSIYSSRLCKTPLCDKIISSNHEQFTLDKNQKNYQMQFKQSIKAKDAELSGYTVHFAVNIPKAFNITSEDQDIDMNNLKGDFNENFAVRLQVGNINQNASFKLKDTTLIQYIKPFSYHPAVGEEVLILGKLPITSDFSLQNFKSIHLSTGDQKNIIIIEPENADGAYVDIEKSQIVFYKLNTTEYTVNINFSN